MQEFSKTIKQGEATRLMGGPAKHCMLYGGSRSGKTFNIIRAIIVRAAKVRSRHVSIRQTFNSIKTSVCMDTLPKVMSLCFPNLKYEFNKTDYFMTLANGSEYWFAGLDESSKRIEKILGKEYSTMHFNECSQLSFSAVQMALTRLAELGDLRNRAWYDQNPPAKSHWSYWQFIRGINPVDDEPLKNPENYVNMIMNPVDNLKNIDGEYIELLESLPEDERNRFLHGMFTDCDDGQVYYEFNRDKHVCDKIKPYYGTTWIGMDFNVDPMTAVIFQMQDGVFNIIDEIFLRNSDTPKMCKALRDKGYSGLKVIPDSTGKSRKTSGQSDFDILKLNGFSILTTFNPHVGDRVNNVNRLFVADKIKISPKCKKLINDLEQVAWKDNKLNQTGESKLLTHISDCLGYGTWKLDPLVGLSKKPIQLG